MIPNFILFVITVPNDILRTGLVMKTLDMIASICQVVMIIELCITINRTRKNTIHKPFVFAIVPIIGFTICYLIYGIVNYII